MSQILDFEIHPKEKTYLIIRIFAAILGYILFFSLISFALTSGSIVVFIPIFFYIILILLYLFFRLGILIGYLQGNAVKVSKSQFPEIHKIVVEQSELLDLRIIPDVYLLQNGGILNAYATRFFWIQLRCNLF